MATVPTRKVRIAGVSAPRPASPLRQEVAELGEEAFGWNFPLAILTGMTAAALVTGNTAIMKPAEQSSEVAAKLMECFMAAGVALTIINSRAVLEALFRHQTAFARTPKYAIGGSQKVKIENIQYRRRSGWLPYAELAVGTFFLGMTAFAIESFNFLAVPFLLLFVGGYYWAGASTLWEEYQGKLAWQKQQAIAAAER